MKGMMIRVIGMTVASMIALFGCYHAVYISEASQGDQGMQLTGSIALFLIAFIIFVVEWGDGNRKS